MCIQSGTEVYSEEDLPHFEVKEVPFENPSLDSEVAYKASAKSSQCIEVIEEL